MRNDEPNGEHIWLRQTVRFTVGEQRRTLEIAVPVPVGARADEVERLLQQASEGMERLTSHLDQRVAAMTGGTPTAAASGTTNAEEAFPSSDARPAESTIPTAPELDTAHPGSRPERAALSAGATPTHESERTPTHLREEAATQQASAVPTATESNPATTAAAASQRARSVPSRPSAPEPSASGRPAPRTPSAPAPVASTPAAPDAHAPELSRRDFLAETNALGLNPRQVMDRLGVRSLDGLNLRESLEVLRRQLVRDAEPALPEQPARADTPMALARSAPSAAAVSGSATAGTYFEEEDDFDFSFSLPDEETAELDHSIGQSMDSEADILDDDDLTDLDDVPDFALPTPPSPPTPAPLRRASPAAHPTGAQHAAPTAGRAPAAGGPLSLPQRARARDLLVRLRATPAGGAPTRGQLTAYANIVVDQLGAASAAALVQGLWGTRVDRLGTDQLNALIQWGKEDDFAEEAPAVAAALQAERAAAERTAAEAGNGTAPARPARSSRPGARASDAQPEGTP